MNTKDCSGDSRLKDPFQPNRRRLPYSGRKLRIYGLLFALWVLILACDLTSNLPNLALSGTATANAATAQAAHQAQVDLAVFATQTAQAQLPSATPIPPSASPTSSPIPPSPTSTLTETIEDTPTPTATETSITETPTASPQFPIVVSNRIHFRVGGTSIYLQVPIQAGIQHAYTVWAKKGQTMIISVSSPNQDVTLDLRGLQGGQQLVWAASQTTYWWDTLPASQDYVVTITTQNPDTYYFLSLEVPANIYFETGAYSATIDGYVDVDTAFHPNVLTRVRYLAYASAGQTMKVKLKSPNLNALSFGIIGQKDGQAYIGYQVKNSEGEILLPTSQGYYLDVYAIDGQSTEFKLELTIQ